MKILKHFGYGRICEIVINGKKRYTPLFVPAISSASKKGNYLDARVWLKRTKPLDLLISAYDYDFMFSDFEPHKECFLILDSGGFELRNIVNPKQWTIKEHMEIIEKMKPDITISLDLPDVNYKESIEFYNQIYENFSKETFIQFVVSESNPTKTLETLKLVLQQIEPQIIGIPEVNLGKSANERIKNCEIVAEILQSMQNAVLFHLLGCSDPEMIRDYALSGVDILDGLGWYRQVIDISKNNDYRFVNFSKLNSSCSCDACVLTKNEDYEDRVFSHNLLAYYQLMENIRNQIIEGGDI